MGKIQDLPPLERPREKATRYGIENLSDQELLTLLIGSGYKGNNAMEVANKLLANSNGFLGLSEYSYYSLTKEKGIKNSKALIISAVFEIHRRINKKIVEIQEDKITVKYLYNKYRALYYRKNQEILSLIILNAKRRIIFEKEMYSGSSENVIYSYKEIWRELYSHNGKYFYLIHNHPDGSSEPSSQDIVFTDELYRESKRQGIPLIDHLIIGENDYYSFQKSEKS